MTTIGFIGLGHMGGPMAANLVKKGFEIKGFDRSPQACAAFQAVGGECANSIAAAVNGADVVITMLPADEHVRAVYLGEGGVFESLQHALLIDSSTISVETSRELHQAAATKGFQMIDAPVSGGTTGAAAGTLTFMVGGDAIALEQARPVLSSMGKAIIHAGGPGCGQAVKLCNNMMLGISMIAVSEAFTLAEKLGLDPQVLYDVSSKASGQSWALSTHCPISGILPNAPASHDFQAGFAAAMMLKDLKLAQAAADQVGASAPLGKLATSYYAAFCDGGSGDLDFSAIIKLIE